MELGSYGSRARGSDSAVVKQRNNIPHHSAALGIRANWVSVHRRQQRDVAKMRFRKVYFCEPNGYWKIETQCKRVLIVFVTYVQTRDFLFAVFFSPLMKFPYFSFARKKRLLTFSFPFVIRSRIIVMESCILKPWAMDFSKGKRRNVISRRHMLPEAMHV